MHETSLKQGTLLKGVLIDPYKKQVALVEVRNDLHVWHKLLRCDCVDVNMVLPAREGRNPVDLWFDDEFLMSDPVGPGFAFIDSKGYRRVYHGYGLMLSSDNEGNSTDMALFSEMPVQEDENLLLVSAMFLAAFRNAIGLRFENWESRLPENTFIEQQMRTVELEVDSTDFRFLTVLD